jgi:hypothetical protein
VEEKVKRIEQEMRQKGLLPKGQQMATIIEQLRQIAGF